MQRKVIWIGTSIVACAAGLMLAQSVPNGFFGFIWAFVTGMVFAWQLRSMPPRPAEPTTVGNTRENWWVVPGWRLMLPSASVLVLVVIVAAWLRPCAWLDLQLQRSSCVRTLTNREPSSIRSSSAVFSPDGSLLALGGRGDPEDRDGGQIIRVADGRLVSIFNPEDRDIIQQLAFSPDGALLAGSSNDKVYLWRVSDGALPRAFAAPFGTQPLAFTADSQELIIDMDRWRVADGTLLERLAGEQGDVQMHRLQLRTEGILFVQSPDGTIQTLAEPDSTSLFTAPLITPLFIH